MKARLSDFARGIEAGSVGAAVQVHDHASAGVVLRGTTGMGALVMSMPSDSSRS